MSHSPRSLVLDCASAAITGAEAYLDPVSAPSNWKDEAKIAAYVAEKTAERLQFAGLDLDLARITAIGWNDDGVVRVDLCRDKEDESEALSSLAAMLYNDHNLRLITYNGLSFDLPLLMRRARYLGVKFPKLNLDRYRSPHVDLMQDLSDRDPQRRRPLGFYVRRLGWTDLVKPLSGEQESQVPVTGKWAELEQSVIHDVTAVYRLACWMGVLQPETVPA